MMTLTMIYFVIQPTTCGLYKFPDKYSVVIFSHTAYMYSNGWLLCFFLFYLFEYKQFEYEHFEYKKFDYHHFEYEHFEYEHFEYENLIIHTRGRRYISCLSIMNLKCEYDLHRYCNNLISTSTSIYLNAYYSLYLCRTMCG